MHAHAEFLRTWSKISGHLPNRKIGRRVYRTPRQPKNTHNRLHSHASNYAAPCVCACLAVATLHPCSTPQNTYLTMYSRGCESYHRKLHDETTHELQRASLLRSLPAYEYLLVSSYQEESEMALTTRCALVTKSVL